MEDKQTREKCIGCKIRTNHELMSSVREEGDEYIDHYLYQIIKCCGCERISFRRRERIPTTIELGGRVSIDIDTLKSEFEPFEWDGVTDVYFQHKKSHLYVTKFQDGTFMEVKELSHYHDTLYPERRDILPKFQRHLSAIPEIILNLYFEVINSFNVKAYRLCAIGMRAVVEAICKELKIEENARPIKEKIERKEQVTLGDKINALSTMRKLSNEQANVLQAHRFFGNEAAHNFEAPTKNELVLTIEQLEQVMNTLFDVPAKQKRLKEKITERVANK